MFLRCFHFFLFFFRFLYFLSSFRSFNRLRLCLWWCYFLFSFFFRRLLRCFFHLFWSLFLFGLFNFYLFWLFNTFLSLSRLHTFFTIFSSFGLNLRNCFLNHLFLHFFSLFLTLFLTLFLLDNRNSFRNRWLRCSRFLDDRGNLRLINSMFAAVIIPGETCCDQNGQEYEDYSSFTHDMLFLFDIYILKLNSINHLSNKSSTVLILEQIYLIYSFLHAFFDFSYDWFRCVQYVSKKVKLY